MMEGPHDIVVLIYEWCRAAHNMAVRRSRIPGSVTAWSGREIRAYELIRPLSEHPACPFGRPRSGMKFEHTN